MESVEILHQALRRTVMDGVETRERPVLRAGDLKVVMEGMKIVGDHPIEALYLDREMRHLIWANMEKKLAALDPSAEDGEHGITDE